MSDLETTDFRPGDRVKYIPMHAHGDITHPDVERGRVTSTNDWYVFVSYDSDSGDTSKATRPQDLVKDRA